MGVLEDHVFTAAKFYMKQGFKNGRTLKVGLSTKVERSNVHSSYINGDLFDERQTVSTSELMLNVHASVHRSAALYRHSDGNRARLVLHAWGCGNNLSWCCGVIWIMLV